MNMVSRRRACYRASACIIGRMARRQNRHDDASGAGISCTKDELDIEARFLRARIRCRKPRCEIRRANDRDNVSTGRAQGCR